MAEMHNMTGVGQADMAEVGWMPENDELISTGEMANLYNISKRTLRLYHEMGLLVPARIDPWNGYRYYTQTQKARLDLILQMKSSGLSLKDIAQLLDTDDISVFEEVLGRQIDLLEKRMQENRVCRDALMRKIEGFRFVRNPPPLDIPFFQYMPRRPALSMDIDPYDLRETYAGCSPWKKALHKVKKIFMDKDIPMALFHQVSGAISNPTVEGREMVYDKAVVLLESRQDLSLPLFFFPSGMYAFMFVKYRAMDQQADLAGVTKLYSFIREKGYQIIGPFLAEVIMEASYLMENENTILVKMQAPVRNVQ